MKNYHLKQISRKVMLKRKKPFTNHVIVRCATPQDVEGIYNVAASVGNTVQDPYDGFLMDDYTYVPHFYKERFSKWIDKLTYFYVAEVKHQIVGFLMAFTKEEWLDENPDWMEGIYWQPDFDLELIKNFVLTDKIAILHGYTALGIGSQMYDVYLKELEKDGYKSIFSETIVAPIPNFASLSFRIKQNFKQVGVRYESYKDFNYTDLIYYRPVVKAES